MCTFDWDGHHFKFPILSTSSILFCLKDMQQTVRWRCRCLKVLDHVWKAELSDILLPQCCWTIFRWRCFAAIACDDAQGFGTTTSGAAAVAKSKCTTFDAAPNSTAAGDAVLLFRAQGRNHHKMDPWTKHVGVYLECLCRFDLRLNSVLRSFCR